MLDQRLRRRGYPSVSVVKQVPVQGERDGGGQARLVILLSFAMEAVVC
jgi:hypothetical protein